ncbi:MAG: DUF5106 domain-containing protein [Paramuribaculum sp.]|nr:DUF5106 domain-containing protein [Paramuribaculum sp.]
MKRIILIALAVAAAFAATPAKAANDTYFPYPIVPDSISTLQGRTTFLVDHFWDLCDLKKGFSSRAKMAGALKDYLSFMPYANARNVHKSIAIFLKKLDKQPDDLLFIAQTAENLVHSDTADIFSDEIFLPFAKAVADNKRIDKADRQHFEQQARVLLSTMTGSHMTDIPYTDRTGASATYSPDSSQVTLIFFNDPSNTTTTSIARARLNADIKASEYIKSGIMKVVSISNVAPDENWKSTAASFPEEWIVGTNPDIADIADIRFTPSFYVIDQNGILLMKNANINQVIAIISSL